MSYRDWIKHPAFGVALFALLALGPVGLSKKYQIISKAEYQTAAQDLDNRQEIRPAIKPPVRNPEPNREEWRGEKDLQAQQTMAMWTVFIGLVTLAGVVYVARTLGLSRATLDQAIEATNASKEAVAVTQRVGEAQTRAYLSIEEVKAVWGEITHELHLSLVNTGNSPANEILLQGRIRIQCRKAPESAFIETAAYDFKAKAGAMASKSPSTVVYSLEPFMGRVVTAMENEGICIEVDGYLLWRDVFGVNNSHPFNYRYDFLKVGDLHDGAHLEQDNYNYGC
ncbi:MAG: hypothetical protein GXP04_08245 [Alphaproteobacteria bacterium]|nr:hypothetical protein [Alphaproteobacteria bacterium]